MAGLPPCPFWEPRKRPLNRVFTGSGLCTWEAAVGLRRAHRRPQESQANVSSSLGNEVTVTSKGSSHSCETFLRGSKGGLP